MSSTSAPPASSTAPSTTPSPLHVTPKTVVIVARHGERLDYVQRDEGKRNWVQDNAHASPYDPPLTAHGIQQASKLGQQLVSLVGGEDIDTDMMIPPITAVYSSPFLRCRQTAAAIVREINQQQQQQQQQRATAATSSVVSVSSTTPTNSSSSSSSSSSNNNLKVKVEEGLAESINESWYRSWSLPGSDGTWGFRIKNKNGTRSEDDASILTNEDHSRQLHPKSLVPIQSILSEWKKTKSADNGNDNDDNTSTKQLQSSNFVDYEYESKTKIHEPYQLYPRNLESQQDQRRRMYETVQQLKGVPGQSIVLVSHGGPVTHLYEQLSGNKWHVHGESTYCCYSIYQQQQQETLSTCNRDGDYDDDKDTNTNNNQISNGDDDSCWTAIVVNESKYLDEELVTERHDQN
jgi:broad specificity phosphatase PhoE